MRAVAEAVAGGGGGGGGLDGSGASAISITRSNVLLASSDEEDEPRDAELPQRPRLRQSASPRRSSHTPTRENASGRDRDRARESVCV